MVAISKYTIDEVAHHQMTGQVFGNKNQITVLGRLKDSSKKNTILLIKCAVCSEDSELFGNGIFKTYQQNITKGSLPCGCSQPYYWSEEQYKILVRRKAEKRGWLFQGWAGEYKGSLTKLELNCHEHGSWNSTNIQAFLTQNHGCSECYKKNTFAANSKPDQEMIDSFIRTGNFPFTSFSRSSEPKKWDAFCSKCDVFYSSHYSNLQRGAVGCNCKLSNQRLGYIAYVKHEEEPIAIKFGIATSVKHRISKQDKNSIYDVELSQVWIFPDRNSCISAERDCKKEILTGVLSKEEYPDGYTETTYVSNFDTVVKTFTKYGALLHGGALW